MRQTMLLESMAETLREIKEIEKESVIKLDVVGTNLQIGLERQNQMRDSLNELRK